MKKKLLLSGAVALMAAVAIIVPNLGGADNQHPKESQYLYASWNYNYASIEELTAASDVIALVRIDGVQKSYEDQGIPFSRYTATILTPVFDAATPHDTTIRPGSSTSRRTLDILMTGMETSQKIIEIIDDPLPRAGEVYLVFCTTNPDGTFQIIGGPQGRLAYIDGTLSSLNIANAQVRANNPYSNIVVDHVDASTLIEDVRSDVSTR
ncbi:MAG: hypothetical protein FWD75_07020 [Propionibacteriaceae bacterium]|nr:hypothetical protein [Propionibacteriaceae bacterium]